MIDPGSLTVEQDGPHVKLCMRYPDHADYRSPSPMRAFVIERFEGIAKDENGNEFEVWAPIHTGTRKFSRGDYDHHLAVPTHHTEDGDPVYDQLPGGKYRALAYRLHEEAHREGGVKILHTEGIYTDIVEI